jgi:CheY-like chemotaxis protein
VLADATQINQILLNLCANASQALQDVSRPGEIGAGEIEVKVSAYEKAEGAAPTALRAGRYVCLTVRDNGPGMDERVRSRIFEPFFTTKPVGKGTGLGLAVVHGIVQEHEASIEVESVVGQGSLFRICFPAIEAPAEVAAPARPEAPAIDGARKHVLFVDDEEAIVYLLKRLLGRLGFVVSGFTDPRQALEAIAADPRGFDLVVTDYNMPGMSGLDVAGAVRAIRPELPVIMASGFISDDLLEKAPLAGVTRLIYKPNTADQLCEAIADLLRKTEPAAAAS